MSSLFTQIIAEIIATIAVTTIPGSINDINNLSKNLFIQKIKLNFSHYFFLVFSFLFIDVSISFSISIFIRMMLAYNFLNISKFTVNDIMSSVIVLCFLIFYILFLIFIKNRESNDIYTLLRLQTKLSSDSHPYIDNRKHKRFILSTLDNGSYVTQTLSQINNQNAIECTIISPEKSLINIKYSKVLFITERKDVIYWSYIIDVLIVIIFILMK